MATQQERDAFLRGWRAAMDEVLAVLATEAQEWAAEEADAAASGEYKLPGSFALEEVRGSFKGRHDLSAWISQPNASASVNADEKTIAAALDALVENRATADDRKVLKLAPVDHAPPPSAGSR